MAIIQTKSLNSSVKVNQRYQLDIRSSRNPLRLTIRIADSNSDDNIGTLHAKNWSDECQEEHRS